MTTIVASKSRCTRSRDTSDVSDSDRDDFVYQIVLESTDSNSDFESTESIRSIQAESTVSARDSSDISTEFSSEFELTNTPKRWRHPWSFTDNNSSSENSFQQNNIVEVEQFETESDTCDISSSASGYDSDECIPILNFTRCAMCSAINENSSFQFCTSCYKIKKGFFPEKPKARKRKQCAEDGMVAAKMTVRSEDKNTEVVSSMVENTADVKCKSRRDSPNCISENCVIGGVSADMNNTVVSNNIADSACNSATDSGFETNNSQDWNTDFAGVENVLLV